jgi:hypothetical protein
MAGAAVALAAALLALFFLAPDAGPVEAESGDWVLTCTVTGGGDESADEQFSGRVFEALAFEQGKRVDRLYKGTRLKARVFVPRGRGGVPRGTHTLYGTVTDVDVLDKRVRMTDCVFVPR